VKSRATKRKTQSQPVLVNLGCGPEGVGRIPAYFSSWKLLRVDIEPAVGPDIIADITDLSAIADGAANAIWTAHCLEHLFTHQVPQALSEIFRVLAPGGLACIVVPDLQVVANLVASDRLFSVLYESPAGPITPHDVMFGFGAAIKAGRVSMAHRCGFTPSVLMQRLQQAGFGEIIARRRPNWELVAVARKAGGTDAADLRGLMTALEL
jgi:SAM-dependent methyltransferase